ncbi:outer membrane protein [Methylobacterium segetis]|uniref:outer membrane protein n=1 Tax=Methylobacterium segetis TaxID=2488750 RepID=UPI001050390B|nr:outer membrane beta-barrel protein [Methylobacterium segetis]
MRTVTVSVLLALGLCGISGAQAADLDYGILRGPEYDAPVPVIDWGGIYFGAHAGYTSAALGYPNRFGDITSNWRGKYPFDAYIVEASNLSGTMYLPSARRDGTSFGGFAGINYQFDEIVVGVEADYTAFGTAGVSTYDRPMLSDRTLTLTNAAATRVEDYGTLRARVGYALGQFLPFVTAGGAIGRAQIKEHVLLTSAGSSTPIFDIYNKGFGSDVISTTNRPYAKTKVVGGFTLGGGLEYALTQNIILRGEYQYVLFNDFDGHKANLNTVRGGAAVKF